MFIPCCQLFTHVGTDIDIRNYVAGGIVTYDLARDKIIWYDIT